MDIRKGDTVLVLVGKDRGKKGKVISANPVKAKVTVAGVNIAKRHTKPTTKNKQGGIIEMPLPVNISNVRLICTHCNKPVAARRGVLASGERTRFCKSCGEVIEKA